MRLFAALPGSLLWPGFLSLLLSLPAWGGPPPGFAQEGKPFVIQVLDAGTERPVPLVRLATVNEIEYHTDNLGLIAFQEPGLMDQEVFFTIRSHGYEYPRDGFGMVGTRLVTKPGETAVVRLPRKNLAERLGRLTGAGRYEHAARAGRPLPSPTAQINAGVLGCDSVHNALFGGRLYWLWGDTNRAKYPLGNFHTTFASTPAPSEAGGGATADPPYAYFTGEDGFVKGIAPMPGDGPTWLGALVTLKDAAGVEHLCATYAKVKPPLTIHERGLCEFDPETALFHKVLTFDKGAALYPDGHPFPHTDAQGREWMYFGQAVPDCRLPATYESWKNPKTYERVRSDVEMRDREAGKKVAHHHGCVAWNPWRKKWLSVFTQMGGESSQLGEIWIAEAPAPEGPWREAVRVVTHDRYSFYNPKWHPYWSEDGGRVVYFEGTYTVTFSGNPDPTPRYEYNQILYRLDLGSCLE